MSRGRKTSRTSTDRHGRSRTLRTRTAWSTRRWVQGACLIGFLLLFFWVCWPYGAREYGTAFRAREVVEAELFLILDPLVSVTTAVAARMLVWSLAAAAGVMLVCLLFPRAFCGYVCPLGTLFDVFDGLLGRRVLGKHSSRAAQARAGHESSGWQPQDRRSWGWRNIGRRRPAALEEDHPQAALEVATRRGPAAPTPSVRVGKFALKREGGWTHVRFYLLAAVMVAAVFGVLLSGFVVAIPVLIRAMLFVLAPVQTGLLKGWYLVPSGNVGHGISILLFAAMLCLGLLGSRFWCRYVCPTGAFLSLVSLLRLRERQVNDKCMKCGRCVEACSFGAINGDFSTRSLSCTSCRTCRGVCPVGAIAFTWRRGRVRRDQQADATVVSRRSVLAGLGGAAVVGVGVPLAAGGARVRGETPIRPPGSVPEDKFLQLCVRCGQCIKVCPNNVLQPAGFERGFNDLWTPQVIADWSGCEPSCNNCGQVCPTGAIRALDLEEKRAARIGLAMVDQGTCLPHAGREACQLCVDECRMAGYNAIEFIRVGGVVDDQGRPIEGSGYLAPVVREDRCIGCGLCQMRCRSINVKSRKRLDRSAIRVIAGPGKEDRITSGSYLALREDRLRQERRQGGIEEAAGGSEYLPDFLK